MPARPGATFHAPDSGAVHLTMLGTAPEAMARQPARQVARRGHPGRARDGVGHQDHAEQGRGQHPAPQPGRLPRRTEADPAEGAALGPAAKPVEGPAEVSAGGPAAWPAGDLAPPLLPHTNHRRRTQADR